MDISGREVYTEKVTLYVGSNDFKLKIADRLETGMYIINVAELGLTKKVSLR